MHAMLWRKVFYRKHLVHFFNSLIRLSGPLFLLAVPLHVLVTSDILFQRCFAHRPERVTHNVHLLYALMHDSHTVEPLFAHPAVRAALEQQDLSGTVGLRVLETTQHYLALLEVKVGANNDSPLTAAQV